VPDHPANFFPLAISPWLMDNWEWIASLAIVVGGLFTVGIHDVARFSFKRTWAISGVCFAESIRKRVLWITPLAILGVIVITQLQKPLDEQDSLRQTVKISLFATGIVVVMVSIILACTNLPREIETRVIYTIVTKPTTRLEIILGKVIGFSRVSFTVLLIMGLFTWGYLKLLEHEKIAQVTTRIREGDVSETERARLDHYISTGMLQARMLRTPDQLQIYGRDPDLHSDIRTISDTGNEDVVAGFTSDRSQLFGDMPPSGDVGEWSHQGVGQFGLVVRVQISTTRTGKATDQPAPIKTGPLGPANPSTAKPVVHLLPPGVSVELLATTGLYAFISSQDIMAAADVKALTSQIADYFKKGQTDPGENAAGVRLSEPVPQPDGSNAQFAYAWVPPPMAIRLFNLPNFYVRLAGVSDNVDYQIVPQSIRVFVPQMTPNGIALESPDASELPPLLGDDGKPAPLLFRGRVGLHGDWEIRGSDGGPSGVGVYSFRDGPIPQAANGLIPFEINVQITREEADVEEGHEDATVLNVQVYDYSSGKTTSQNIQLESHQTTFFDVPADAITGPNFDVIISCKSAGHIVGLFPDQSLQLVTARESFALNLIKSLSILWMLSILVLTLSVLCSTFVSWPIAIVLTIVLLLGRWGFNELSDTSGPGLGAQIVNDFRFNDAPVAKVVSTSVDALSRGMHYFSLILPDTSTFDAVGSIQEGVGVSNDEFLQALEVVAGFGLPAIVIAYLILRGKEVAP
jgi:hypothetical protein